MVLRGEQLRAAATRPVPAVIVAAACLVAALICSAVAQGAELISPTFSTGEHSIIIPSGNYGSDRAFLTTSLAAPPVETGGAVAHREQADLSGTVDPEGQPVTSCGFEYGETEAYGHIAQCPSSPEGEGPKAVSATVTGLEPGTTYHYRLVAANSAGTSYGSDRAFSTTPLIAPPVETRYGVSGSEKAELIGEVDPENHPLTSCQFEYGETEAYGAVSQCASLPHGEGFQVVRSNEITGLHPVTAYHFRLVASNVAGTSYGPDRTFGTWEYERAFVHSLSPASGPASGGTTVTITGEQLQTVTSVTFGGVPASSLTVSRTTVTAVSPPGTGRVRVLLRYPLGEADGSFFNYRQPPTIKRVTPKQGSAAGGTAVTIVGSALDEASEVLFGTSPATILNNSSTGIVVTAPPGTTGATDVRVVTPGGMTAISSKDIFKYANPVINSLAPAHGPVGGGTAVTVTGSGFAIGAGKTTFVFGKTAATGVSCASTALCTMSAPAASKIGTVSVAASVAGKKSQNRAEFTYE
jgi:hypothetical protein